MPPLTRTALEAVWEQSHRLTASERWYAVHTLPFAEARAEGQLHRQGFRTFQPKRHKTIRHARRLSTIEAPFFPRYLFIVLDLGRHQWRSINGTFGVSRLLMRGEEPHPVPHGVVEALIAAADARHSATRPKSAGGRAGATAGGPIRRATCYLGSSGRIRTRPSASRHSRTSGHYFDRGEQCPTDIVNAKARRRIDMIFCS
jgi:hypothetical protein